MHSNQHGGATARQRIADLTSTLRNHRALTRVSLATLSLGIALAASLQGAAAGPDPASVTRSILPETIGTGVPTDASLTIGFEQTMDEQSVVDALSLTPTAAWVVTWSNGGRSLQLSPRGRWRADARYLVSIGDGARTARGESLASARTLSFTTETAPVIAEFRVEHVAETPVERVRSSAQTDRSGAALETASPDATTADVSARTSIRIGFSAPMRRDEAARAFALSPMVRGQLTWEGGTLVFVPNRRLEPGTRYSVSLVGAHDLRGNPLGGDLSFSFVTRKSGQVLKVAPKDGARGVSTDEVRIWFSGPMDRAATRAALRIESARGAAVTGKARWNDDATQLRYTFRKALAKGTTYRIVLERGARDADGNRVTGSWKFTSKEARAPAPAPAVTSQAAPAPIPSSGPAAPADTLSFALWQINQSRARYGFAPLRLDAAITQVATDYAWDMMNYGYFSHTGRDGSRVADRLRRAGIGFSYSGENICYHSGISVRATLEWCHSVFMAEPYPGYYNHIANILNPRYTRVGIGIAASGGQVKIVWDFAG